VKLEIQLIERPIESYLVVLDDSQTIGSISFHSKDGLISILDFICEKRKELKFERVYPNT
jgi:hypothetical protein